MSLVVGPGPELARALPTPPRDAPLWRAAQALEAGFLTEILKSTDLGTTTSGLGGGPEQGHFRSFLLQAQAERLVQSGGIGLAEPLYQAMQRAAAPSGTGS